MRIELRPLSAGEVLDRTFQLYRARFGMFVGIATVAAAIQTAGSALQSIGGHWILAHHRSSQIITIWGSFSTLIGLCITLLALSVVFAAITRAVIALHREESTGIAQAYREVWPRWFRFVRLSIASGFLSLWPFLLVVGTLAGEIALAPKYRTAQAAGMATTAFGFTAVEILVAIPVCIWLVCRYALCVAACVNEDTTVGRSLKRSVELSKDLRWRIFLLLLLIYILQIIFSGTLIAPTLAILARSRGHVPLGITIYQLTIGFIASSLASPIYAIGLTVIYLDARIRKEGYDIELMMQGAGARANPLAGESTGLSPG
jgi:hypothetical protein